jgi:hypothetical protein
MRPCQLPPLRCAHPRLSICRALAGQLQQLIDRVRNIGLWQHSNFQSEIPRALGVVHRSSAHSGRLRLYPGAPSASTLAGTGRRADARAVPKAMAFIDLGDPFIALKGRNQGQTLAAISVSSSMIKKQLGVRGMALERDGLP